MKYTVKLERKVTDWLCAEVEISAKNPAAAMAKVQAWIDAGTTEDHGIEFQFDQCGEVETPEIIECGVSK